MFDLEQQKKQENSYFALLFICFVSISICVLFTFNFRYDFSYNVVYIRHWQYLLALFSGGALGVAGMLLQKITKNNLSDISILGIGTFNIICIILYIFCFFDGTTTRLIEIKKYLPFVSILSSIAGTSLIYYLCSKNKNNFNNFIITGIALQFLFEAITLAILNLIGKQNQGLNHQLTTEISNYSYGRFGDIAEFSKSTPWRIITVVSFVLIVIICCVIYFFNKQIDLIEINDEYAQANGVSVKYLKIFLFFCIALLAGLESALVGTISLLGIIAPNIAKMIFGNKARTNVLASFFIGGMLVLAATFISVNLGQNIPIGALSTAIIAPFFIYLIFKNVR